MAKKKKALKMKNVEKAKKSITQKQKKMIRDLYKDAADKIAKEAERLSNDPNQSKVIKQMQLRQLEQKLRMEQRMIDKEILTGVRKSAFEMAFMTCEATKEWLKSAGMKDIGAAFSNVPRRVVENIATGNVYEGGWNLSEAIWKHGEKNMQDIHKIIAEGVAMNKSSYDIAKDLEKYVKPSAKKDWKWSKVYPGTNKKVDYNAQRLARTMTQHAYQQSFVETTIRNPWITKYRWVSNGSRSCPKCQDMDGTLFEKDELPLDHPCGMCVVVPEIEKSWDDITTDIANWYHEPLGTYPEIDDYALSFFE